MGQEPQIDNISARVKHIVKYREVVNYGTRFGLIVMTRDGRFLEVNHAILEDTGMSLNDLVGKYVVEMPWWSHSLETRLQIREVMERAMRGETVRFDIRVFPRSDFYRDVDVTIMPFLDSTRQGEYLIWTGFDVTERKRLEDEKHFLIDAIPTIIWTARPDGYIDYLNKQWSNYTLTSIEQSRGDGWSECVHPDDRQKALANWYNMVHTGEPGENEYRLRNGITGEYRWFLVYTVPIRDVQGNIVGWCGTCTDNHDKKMTEFALRMRQLQFRTLFDANIIGIGITDIYGHVWEANDAYLQMLGSTREDMNRGEVRWDQLTAPEYLERDEKAIQELRESGTCYPYEKEYQHPDGKRVPVVVGAALLDKESGKAISFFVDITARKELEKRKDEFISLASHELKTPVTSLKMLVQFLRRRVQREGDKRTNYDLMRMELQVDALKRLIDDLLNVSKIQMGLFSYEDEILDPDKVLHETIEILQPTLSDHVLILHGHLHHVLVCDPQRFTQVVNNLVTNAVKYSPEAHEVDIFLSESERWVCIKVCDHGVGIPAPQREKIFERFNRGAYGTSEKAFPGLGMGLYITYEIVTHYHGSITVESEEGKGSTFTVCLPFAQQT
ncbi:PAS domain-containing sensor histidine kinase [Ktedonobacter robiniae]|uniref:histidine kinase n=1 Tax=Ktedonobacter robiniae TaxID=2778365 RepID=A0ABQ3UWX1_9CHLR|nr:PAS domain-containing sensor histidine kinase [Ktedonobacter robiniae]GHO56892.1 hypothetical protein KSB_53670 [Ktedonobacter robiniae]